MEVPEFGLREIKEPEFENDGTRHQTFWDSRGGYIYVSTRTSGEVCATFSDGEVITQLADGRTTMTCTPEGGLRVVVSDDDIVKEIIELPRWGDLEEYLNNLEDYFHLGDLIGYDRILKLVDNNYSNRDDS